MNSANSGRRRAPGDPPVAPGQAASPSIDDEARFIVRLGPGLSSVTIEPIVDDTTDTIAAAAAVSSIASYLLAFNELAGQNVRARALELTEGVGFPAFSITGAQLPYLFDEVASGGLGNFFISRGRLGVQMVRDPGPRGTTPLQFAIDQVGGATPFRRLLATGKKICALFEPVNNTTAAADFSFWQLWDLATVASVPTVLGTGVLPVKVVPGNPRNIAQAPQLWPAGGYQLSTGMVIAVSSAPLIWVAPPAGLLTSEAITNVLFYDPELPF